MQSIDPCKSVDSCGTFREDAILQFPSIRIAFMQRWSFFHCEFAIRGGPAIVLNLSSKQKVQSSARYSKTGFGLGLSLITPKLCRRKLEIAVYLV